jgi:SAM-dependent methyltransferase
MRFSRLQADWDHLGAADPFWAVLSDPQRRGAPWDEEAFFRTGQEEITYVMSYIDQLMPDLPRGRALDFGCGPGRLTQALAHHFDSVTGVDISPSMIELARSRPSALPNCEFCLNTRSDLALLEDSSFDLVYSRIVLQHMPPQLARQYLKEFVRVINPGGLALVQIPSGRTSPRLPAVLTRFRESVAYTLKSRRNDEARVRMFGVARSVIEDDVASAGGRVLNVAPDTSSGPARESWMYAIVDASNRHPSVPTMDPEWQTP